MKVAVVSSVHPFIKSGARIIVDSLERQLRAHGHEVEVLNIPVQFSPETYLDQSLAFRLLDVSEWGERLIAVRAPSHLMAHPAKNVWFIHHWRYLFDLWDTPHGPDPKTHYLRGLRDMVQSSDTVALGEARNVFANSKVVADRVTQYNGVHADVLYPPVEFPERFSASDYGDFLVCVSRVTPIKRQLLMVQAMAHVKTDVRLVLAGRADYPAAAVAVDRLIEELGLSKTVSFTNEWVSEAEKEKLFAECLANVYLPEDEDSYGYSTLEAAHSGKCTITTTDSGGVMEFVQTGLSGFSVEPDPLELAEVFDRLYSDRDLAKQCGTAALYRIGELGISWSSVVEALLR